METSGRVRVAAAGDVHASEAKREQIERAFSGVRGEADLVVLAGDLTSHGEPSQAAILAEACRGLDVPVVAVLGNHDWHADRVEEVAGVLAEAGVTVLDRSSTVMRIRGTTVGIVGAKGFMGGFGGQLANFGEPLMRQCYAETTAEVEALERGLGEIAHCALRIAALHYAPIAETLEGEPQAIWAFLGSERLAFPLAVHRPDLVLHGHGHAGTFAGSLDSIPVFNVAVPVIGRDFWLFELEPRVDPQVRR